MEEIIKLVQQSYGLVGLILAAPMVAMVYLWNDNKKLQKEVIQAQKDRLGDAQKISDKLIEMTSEYAGLNKEMNIALDRIVGVLETLQTKPCVAASVTTLPRSR